MLTAAAAVDNVIAGRREKVNIRALSEGMEYRQPKMESGAETKPRLLGVA